MNREVFQPVGLSELPEEEMLRIEVRYLEGRETTQGYRPDQQACRNNHYGAFRTVAEGLAPGQRVQVLLAGFAAMVPSTYGHPEILGA